MSKFVVGRITALLILFLGITPLAQASTQPQFGIDYDINYDILDTGETLVTQNVVLTNLKGDIIPTNYTFTSKQMHISEITGTVNNKRVEPKKEIKSDEILVTITIPNYAIGEGRQNKISLGYKTKDLTSKVGEIWNIYIPKIQIPTATSLYNVRVSIPTSLGPKVFISPTPSIEKIEENKYVYYFSKENFSNTGINGAFGRYQLLNFRIKYQIKNPNIIRSKYEIALPVDILNQQQTVFKEINPKPDLIKKDTDGNSIAIYTLKPRETKEIEIIGSSKILGRQINPNMGGKLESLTKDLVQKYTKDQKYWEVKSPSIQELAKKLKNNNLTVSENAYQIYEYITNNLSYNYDALKEQSVVRQGALNAITKRGTWTCMEFTDLFIATARAMGIPAREINGYAFTNSENNKPISISLRGGDLLHSWPEFFDPYYGWVQIDPTWGTTSGMDYFSKLDTNHFAFVIKGTSSEYPLPAGAYRFNQDKKLVDVDFSQNEGEKTLFEPKVEIKPKSTINIFQLIKGNSKYQVRNLSGMFIYYEQLEIPPFATKEIYLNKNSKDWEYHDLQNNKFFISWE